MLIVWLSANQILRWPKPNINSKPTLALDPLKVDHYLLHTASLVREVFVHSGVQSFVWNFKWAHENIHLYLGVVHSQKLFETNQILEKLYLKTVFVLDSHSNYSKFKRVIKRLIWLIPLIWPEGKERWITWFIPVHLIGQLKGLVSSRDDFNQTKMIIAVELKFFADSNIFFDLSMAKIPLIDSKMHSRKNIPAYLHIRSNKISKKHQTKQDKLLGEIRSISTLFLKIFCSKIDWKIGPFLSKSQF